MQENRCITSYLIVQNNLVCPNFTTSASLRVRTLSFKWRKNWW